MHGFLSTNWCRTLLAIACTGMFAWAAIWCAYGLRYRPMPHSDATLDEHWFVQDYGRHALIARLGREPTPEEMNPWRTTLSVRLIQFANRHHLAPNAYLMGLLYTQGSALSRDAFLLGSRSVTGWWYYFPLALIFKLPVITLLAIIVTAPDLLYPPRHRSSRRCDRRRDHRRRIFRGGDAVKPQHRPAARDAGTADRLHRRSGDRGAIRDAPAPIDPRFRGDRNRTHRREHRRLAGLHLILQRRLRRVAQRDQPARRQQP